MEVAEHFKEHQTFYGSKTPDDPWFLMNYDETVAFMAALNTMDMPREAVGNLRENWLYTWANGSSGVVAVRALNDNCIGNKYMVYGAYVNTATALDKL